MELYWEGGRVVLCEGHVFNGTYDRGWITVVQEIILNVLLKATEGG